MTLPVKADAYISRFAKRLDSGRETQRQIAESMGLTSTCVSTIARFLRTAGVPIAKNKPGPRTAKAKAPTKVVIAAKATTARKTNGARAH